MESKDEVEIVISSSDDDSDAGFGRMNSAQMVLAQGKGTPFRADPRLPAPPHYTRFSDASPSSTPILNPSTSTTGSTTPSRRPPPPPPADAARTGLAARRSPPPAPLVHVSSTPTTTTPTRSPATGTPPASSSSSAPTARGYHRHAATPGVAGTYASSAAPPRPATAALRARLAVTRSTPPVTPGGRFQRRPAASPSTTPAATTNPVVRLGSMRASVPTIAPGSPVDVALAATVTKKSGFHRPHKPKLLKVLKQGKAAYERKKREKTKGKIINENHTFYHLSFGMMLGIYTSVVNLRSVSKLTLDDFMRVKKLIFPPEGTSLTPPHSMRSPFKFKDYAPRVFHHLRERFQIDAADYLSSLGGAYEYIEFMSNSKSGQFFFYSHDGKFMIKTQTKAESKFLRRILAHYYEYCMKTPHTYITRFYGMHRVKMKHIRTSLHFVIMQSVFYGDKEIHRSYDLKGSSVGREATETEKDRGDAKCVYKDNDLASHHEKIKLGPTRKAAFLEQIQSDARFLESLSIMDYSLLLGIHRKSLKFKQGVRRASVHVARDHPKMLRQLAEEAAAEEAEERAGAGAGASAGERSPSPATPRVRPPSSDKSGVAGVEPDGSPSDEVYFFGIIDILQQYDLKKKGESMLKSIIHPRDGVSSVDPKRYATRFVDFLNRHSV